MKHCLKSDPEPTCLADFRHTQPQGIWDDFRDVGRSECYQTVRAITRSDQGGLCAYCERLLPPNDQQIAHFHPKWDTQGPPNWALHWLNLWFACSGGNQTWLQNPDAFLPPPAENLSCDVAKEDDIVDGQVLSPAEIPAFPPIFRYKQSADRMDIAPDDTNCTAANVTVSLAQATVDVFNLNCSRLAEARSKVHRNIERQIKRIHQNSPQPEAHFRALAQRLLSKTTNNEWPQFFTMIRWRFGPTAETHLESINYQG